MKSCECCLVLNIKFVGRALLGFTNIAQFTMSSIIPHAEFRMIASRSISFMYMPGWLLKFMIWSAVLLFFAAIWQENQRYLFSCELVVQVLAVAIARTVGG